MAVFAVAGPVNNDTMVMSNLEKWPMIDGRALEVHASP